MKIYNNPTCSKCVSTLALLEEKGVIPEIINYLDTPPSAEELAEVIQKLGIAPIDLIRKKESVFQEKYVGKNLSDQEWIKAMIENPILIERPIVINGNMAIIGRPPARILDII